MSPLAGPLGSSTSARTARSGGQPGASLPMQDLRPSGRRSARPGIPAADQLSDRDRQIIDLVARFRIMSGAQLRELCWPEGNLDTRARLARRGLARLARLDLLAPLERRVGGVRAGSAGLTFAIGPAGQRLLAAGAGRVRRAHTPGERHLAHTLAVAQLYVDLRRAERQAQTELLAFQPEPHCWRSFTGPYGERYVLKPDAFVKLGIGAYEDSWFIELDLGSEGTATLAGKARRYVECQDSGVIQVADEVFPRTLWIAPDGVRAEVIRRAVAPAAKRTPALFAVTTAPAAVALLTGARS